MESSNTSDVTINLQHKGRTSSFFAQPGVLAADFSLVLSVDFQESKMDKMQEQKTVARLIKNSFGNFKKLGKDLMTAGACVSRMEQLKVRWEEFEKNHKAMMADEATDAGDDYFAKNQYEISYEDFLMNMGLYQDHLLKVKREISQLGAKSGTKQIEADMDANRAKLPQIIIGDFSDDIQDWLRFRDTFNEMVIDRPNLPNIFRMNYLRTYVKGEAAELLREIPSGGEHFANTQKVLLNHYDYTRLLIHKLLESLMSMPAMVDNSASELMRELNGTRNILQALKALGSPVDHWDHFTVFLTRSKIRLQCQAKWEDSVKQKEHSTTPSSFDELCKFLEAERSTLSLLESNKEFARKLRNQEQTTRPRRVKVEIPIILCKQALTRQRARYAPKCTLLNNAANLENKAWTRENRLSVKSDCVTITLARTC
ncbi:unnamed protein product [Trichogramma brassicae]|uniref:Uncharacterized protein n=1 Tax=Trichogramma brassicae TaxID=86971 RepID=A0A6H5IK38_9HYME|nr:unnamed protein product [Trichogramma brassicae]